MRQLVGILEAAGKEGGEAVLVAFLNCGPMEEPMSRLMESDSKLPGLAGQLQVTHRMVRIIE